MYSMTQLQKIQFAVSIAITTLCLAVLPASAAGPALAPDHDPHLFAYTLLALAGILVGAKFFHLIERINLPPVVGELIAGIFLGNLAIIGFDFFSVASQTEIITFLAEIGVVLLLFQIGLESNISQLANVGATSLLVALIGAILPFVLGAFVIGPLLLGDETLLTYLFVGAALAATSVGIAARIFKDAGKLKTRAARIVVGAAVIDDLLGLVLLSVISTMALEGAISGVEVVLILVKSLLFLILSIGIGQLLAPFLSRAFALINTGMGSKFTLALSMCLVAAGIADLIGLEPIIGGFAAGLVLDPVHFKNYQDPELIATVKESVAEAPQSIRTKLSRAIRHHSEHSIEEIIEPLTLFLVPVFFVVTGMTVHLESLVDVSTITVAIILTVVAVVSKILAGLPAGKSDRATVGIAMIPRGEVGLIFAAIGQSLGVVSPELFAIIVLTVLMTTIVGPFMLARQLKAS